MSGRMTAMYTVCCHETCA